MLKPLEPDNMAFEHLLGVPEVVSVGGVAGGLAFLLRGMTRPERSAARRPREPAVLQEPLDPRHRRRH